MADGSWDNSGAPPEKKGMPLWAKISLGCGVAFLLVLGTCVAGGMYIAHRAKQDPEGLKKQMVGFALDRMRPEWEEFRTVVNQLRTEEGCKTLYVLNPELSRTWSTEAAFLESAKAWRKDLEPAPELTMELLEKGNLNISKDIRGQMRTSWRPVHGPEVTVVFNRPHLGASHPRKVMAIEVGKHSTGS